MSMIPDGMSSVPDMGPTPPDMQPQTLDDAYNAVEQILGRDGLLTEDEQSRVVQHLQFVKMLGEASAQAQAQQGGQPGMNPMQAAVQGRMQQGGFSTPQERQTAPAQTWQGR